MGTPRVLNFDWLPTLDPKEARSVYSSKSLLDAVWSSEAEASTETVRSWLRNLRGKLVSVGVDHLIKTIPGSGYLIEYRPV